MLIRQDKVNDIKEGIDAYTSIAAMVSQGNPVIVAVMADWLTTLTRALVEWGAMTEEEHDVLIAMLAREAEHMGESDQDETQLLIQHQGI